MGQVFRHAEQYLGRLTKGSWVEIGTGRAGDDGSTRVLAKWAQEYDRYLWTVDIDPHHCDLVRLMTLPNVEVVQSTGEAFLQQFPAHIGYISLLYLDNFDWDWHPDKFTGFIEEQKRRYSDLGLTMNNVNSQRAHLRQADLALKALAPASIVICDDTWFNPYFGHFTGKSGAAVPHLLNNGFEILFTQEAPLYGTILGRGV